MKLIRFLLIAVATGLLPFVSLADGGPGNGVSFGPYGSAIIVSNASGPLPGTMTQVTIEFWAQVRSPRQASAVVFVADDIHQRCNIHLPWSDGVVYWDFGDISTGGRMSFTFPTNAYGTWQHFAFVSDTVANQMSIYMNGKLVSVKGGAKTWNTGFKDLWLGSLTNNVQAFDGTMDEFRFWTIARSDADIARDYNVRLTGAEPSLYLNMHMDEASGTLVTNTGSFTANTFGGHGILVNGAFRTPSGGGTGRSLVTSRSETFSGYDAVFSGTIKPDSTNSVRWWFAYGTNTTAVQTVSNQLAELPVSATVSNLAAGIYNVQLFVADADYTNSSPVDSFTMPNPAAQTALYYTPANNAYAYAYPTGFPITNQPFTIEAWVYPVFDASAPSADLPLMTFGNRAGSQFNYFALTHNGLRHSFGGSTDLYATTTNLFDGWHHVAVTYDGTTRTILLDGVVAASDAPAQPNVAVTTFLTLGYGQDPNPAINGYNHFAGSIDEVSVWNIARTASDISNSRFSRLNGQETGLLAYYPFDQANAALDASGHNNDLSGYPGVEPASTVPLNAPLVQVLPAAPVLGTSATLNGMVHPLGRPTVVHFEYGSTPALGLSTTNLSLAGIYALTNVSITVIGLDPGTDYYYRLVAGNSVGTTYSAVQHFHTLLLGYGWPVATKVTGGQALFPKVGVDLNGNTLLSGQITGSATFGNTTLVPPIGTTNSFVGELSTSGDWRWVRAISNAWTLVTSIKADAAGNILVSGNYSGTPQFSASLSLPTTTNQNGFVAKLDPSGNWLWAARLSAGSNACAANDLSMGLGGDAYVAGEFSGALTLTHATNGSRNLSATAATNGFTARLNTNGTWVWASAVTGAGASRVVLAVTTAPAGTENLWVAGQFAGSATFGATTLASAGGQDMFLAQLDGGTGAWNLAKRGGGAGADRPDTMIIGAAGDVFLAANYTDSGDFDGAATLPGTGDTLHIMHLTSSAALQWYADGPGASAGGLSIGQDGFLYVSGDFANNLVLAGGFGLSSVGGRDVFLAKIDPASGSYVWAQRIGSQGDETSGQLVTDPTGTLITAGTFQLTMQVGYVALSTANQRDIFVARFDTGGVFEHNRWTIGQAVPIPVEALDPSSPNGAGTFHVPTAITILSKVYPDSTAANSFVWSIYERKLYAVRPVTAQISWPRTADLANLTRVVQVVGTTHWPTNIQTVVAGAPANLEPQIPLLRYRVASLAFDAASSTLDLTTHLFTSHTGGYAVVEFLKTDGALPVITQQPLVFEVLRSVTYNDPTQLSVVSANVGDTLHRASHADPEGKNGYVYFYYSPYDGTGGDRAHDRDTRKGPIIAVNHDAHFNPPNPGGNNPDGNFNSDGMFVIWYHTNTVTGVAWPDDPVQYSLSWPTPGASNTIVIASGLGSGLLDPVLYQNLRIYNQPNRSLPGFNPNEEHALVLNNTVFALRNDLNAVDGNLSAPYVLAKYTDPNTHDWAMKVYYVTNQTPQFPFQYSGQAGNEIQPPLPLSLLPLCGNNNRYVSGPGYLDYKGHLYARAAGADNSPTNVVVQWFYPMQPGFYADLTGSGSTNVNVGDCVPWLDHLAGGVIGTPVNATYQITWPQNVPVLSAGDILYEPKLGLPGIKNFASARIIYDQSNPSGPATNSMVRMFDPISDRVLQISPDAAHLRSGPGIGVYVWSGGQAAADVVIRAKATLVVGGLLAFPDLPSTLQRRLFYDAANHALIFRGLVDESVNYGGSTDPLFLPNVLTDNDRPGLLKLSGLSSEFQGALLTLESLTQNPNHLDLNNDGQDDNAVLLGLNYETLNTDPPQTIVSPEKFDGRPKALFTTLKPGGAYVTIVENDDRTLPGLPVTLHVIRVGDGLMTGDIKVINPDNVFDERLSLRHSGFFPADLNNVNYEWYYHPASAGFSPTNLPVFTSTSTNFNNWLLYKSAAGLNEITLGTGGESSLLVLGNNYFCCRYKAPAAAGFPGFSAYSGVAGAPGGGQAQIAEGYVQRVVFGLNPFEARTKDFHSSPASTYTSMLRQAGKRYEGDIALNSDPNYINSIGLIEAYETVEHHAGNLSVNGTPAVNYGPANDALLLAASRVSDLYMLLGNEAYADAADPTIGFRTDGTGYGSLAPSIFCFQNQVNSLLEEELCLLRGRDDSSASVRTAPVYNRLFWNFTHAEGEVAYAQNYNITDQDNNGLIDANDAAIMFPQGHGDAWGHYLTAVTTFYDLLRNTNFTWIPQTEEILLAGQPVEVGFQNERKFAVAAAARAKTGAEILDLTYRLNYVDDPAGQFQGYKDTNPDRSWGADEWARRAGTGAYLDWVMATALLPAIDPNTNHAGIQKIDRTTVLELGEIPTQYSAIQDQMDKSDAGLNPLGVAKSAVPFDIDPSAVSAGQTHFEQIYARALAAVNNAVSSWNNANQLTTALRSEADTQTAFSQKVSDQEHDYQNRLLEIFGYPYAGDMGPGQTYPSGYTGADLYHWMYVDGSTDAGQLTPQPSIITAYYTRLGNLKTGLSSDAGHFFNDFGTSVLSSSSTNLDSIDVLPVSYPVSVASATGFGFSAPAAWGVRRAPGEIQSTLNDVLQSQTRLKQSILNYKGLLAKIDAGLANAEADDALDKEKLTLHQQSDGIVSTLKIVKSGLDIVADQLDDTKDDTDKVTDAVVEALPKVLGLANDVTAPARGAIKAAIAGVDAGVNVGALLAKIGKETADNAADITKDQYDEKIDLAENDYATAKELREVEELIREEAPARLEITQAAEVVTQTIGKFRAAVAKGEQLIEERVAFRQRSAAETQQTRYQDMTFRIFRNDALQKYRATFDVAARYVFLAANAYDYETQLLGGNTGSGREFLTDIVRQRSLGQVVNGSPVAGIRGISDPLARLGENFAVLKGQLGFNNPQTETGRFSLRHELFRIRDTDNAAWQTALNQHRVANLWDIPEFRRYCKAFAPESAGAQPGIVIRFPTTVTFGLNYFGWPLGGGDNSYDPTVFATRIRSAGIWFQNYLGSGLSQTPRVYLVPVGAEVFRSPSGTGLDVRMWHVVDQKIPVPFPIGNSSFSDPTFIPMDDSLSDTFGDIRRFSSFRAYHDSGTFTDAETVSDSRLIGRSVWNTEWMLIIPGGTFLYNPNQGLDTFSSSCTDIKVFFQTYGYSGN